MERYARRVVGAKQSEQQRRESILAAAAEVAGRSGLEAVNARAVASTAGLSHGLVYFYFDTKEGLLRGLLDRVMADVCRAAGARARPGG